MKTLFKVLASVSIIFAVSAFPGKVSDDLAEGTLENLDIRHLLPKARKPELVRISIQGIKHDGEVCSDINGERFIKHNSNSQINDDEKTKQIPIISDIERIKRIAEILTKIGDVIGSLPPIQTANINDRAEKRAARNDNENEAQSSNETTLRSTSVD